MNPICITKTRILMKKEKKLQNHSVCLDVELLPAMKQLLKSCSGAAFKADDGRLGWVVESHSLPCWYSMKRAHGKGGHNQTRNKV